MAFVKATRVQTLSSRSTIITFLEFLTRNSLLYGVIMHYVSAFKFYFCQYQISTAIFEDHFVKKLMRGIQYSVHPAVVPKDLFPLSQIPKIAKICKAFGSTLTYRGVFLLAFYGLFCISNIAASSSKALGHPRHILRRNIRFVHLLVHITLKWAKNLQASEKILSMVMDPVMRPVSCLIDCQAYNNTISTPSIPSK